MFLSVPAHATFGILMGYFIGMAKYQPKRRLHYFVWALLWAIAFHGLFDFFLFAGKTLLHFAGAIFSFMVAVKLSRRAIRKKQEISKAYWNQDNTTVSMDPSLFNKN
jgi:RsiW-degrading membrane proteinase PrsW (M82 family)